MATIDHGPFQICEVDIYELDVAFFWDADFMADFYKENFDIDLPEDADSVKGRAYMHGEEGGTVRFAILIRESADWWHYVHECSHMVDMIFKQLGISTGWKSTEPRAYLIAYLFKELCTHSPYLAQSQEED